MQIRELPKLIGESGPFKRSLHLIKKFSPSDACILLQGETGTGKELSARAIHYLSRRRDFPFVPANCGAFPETLIESELFGHKKGAFTDARDTSEGLIAEAEGGTLFLDEIDSMPLKAQVSLLRFLQDRTYRPLGSRRERRSDVRIIAAASSNFEEHIKEGRFRRDLAYRLSVLEVNLPPLRERLGDPLLLAVHFIRKYSGMYRTEPKQLDRPSIGWLDRYDWPGNIRELENKIHRGLIISDDQYCSVVPEEIEPNLFSNPTPGPNLTSMDFNQARKCVLDEFEKRYLTSALTETNGNVTAAAKLANKERRAFGKLLKKHHINRKAFVRH